MQHILLNSWVKHFLQCHKCSSHSQNHPKICFWLSPAERRKTSLLESQKRKINTMLAAKMLSIGCWFSQIYFENITFILAFQTCIAATNRRYSSFLSKYFWVSTTELALTGTEEGSQKLVIGTIYVYGFCNASQIKSFKKYHTQMVQDSNSTAPKQTQAITVKELLKKTDPLINPQKLRH